MFSQCHLFQSMEKKTLSISLIALTCVLGNTNLSKGTAEAEILHLDLIFSTDALMIDGDGTLNHFKYHERRITSF